MMMSKRRSTIARFFLPVFFLNPDLVLALLFIVVEIGILVFKSNV
tara:strand:+ start:1631 stop:1765 length:135 start_codon:yes stop_codon:yes gene_type:complete